MSDFSYPYPAFSWSITQHIAPATNVHTLFEFLKSSYLFSKEKNYQDKITDYMISRGLLTSNVRKDQNKPQLWRDYQQILPEIGLIVSTKYTNGISVTPMGLLWLDGGIGYSEMLTTQCINYQYPNGHKQDLSPTVIKSISEQNLNYNNRVLLDTINGVLIKPAVLILRVLIELFKSGNNEGLSADETVIALMPTKRNKDWFSSIERLTIYRNNPLQKSDKRRKRHVQEWYRLLNHADFFTLTKNQNIQLSLFAINNIQIVERYCQFHENEENFWIPHSNDKTQLGFSWFEYFGAPSLERQWATNSEFLTQTYVSENYPEGVLEIDEEYALQDNFEIQLNKLREIKHGIKFIPNEINVDNILAGYKKRDEKTKLHDEIVKSLAQKLISLNFDVWEDRNSVDLLAKNSVSEVIFEVKTVNKNNLSKHLRVGVGQLLEYRYRREIQVMKRPKSLLVLSSKYNFPNWMIDYFEKDVELGVLSFEGQLKFDSLTSGATEWSIANS